MKHERNFKLSLAYDGTAFKGWQRLPGKARTVQDTIEKILQKIIGDEIEIIGASRTDSGVHAMGQAANFHAITGMEAPDLMRRLNAALPEDIACRACEEMDLRFHARFRTSEKKYRYRILNAPIGDPLRIRYVHHIPESLKLEAMQDAAKVLVGEHDFSSFTNLKEKEKSFVRDLRSIWLERKDDVIDIVFMAEGFLYNQARIMAGSLIEVGLGRLDSSGLRKILEAKDRSKASGAAPARGLVLENVAYAED